MLAAARSKGRAAAGAGTQPKRANIIETNLDERCTPQAQRQVLPASVPRRWRRCDWQLAGLLRLADR